MPVLAGVAQHVAPVELVQVERAGAARQPHCTALEQLLELLHDAEHPDPLVLVDVVEIADGDDALGVDVLVVGGHALGHLHGTEPGCRVRADAGQLRQAAVGRPGRAGISGGRRVDQRVDLPVQLLSQGRVRDQAAGQPLGDLLAQRLDAIEPVLVILLREHGSPPLLMRLAAVAEPRELSGPPGGWITGWSGSGQGVRSGRPAA